MLTPKQMVDVAGVHMLPVVLLFSLLLVFVVALGRVIKLAKLPPIQVTSKGVSPAVLYLTTRHFNNGKLNLATLISLVCRGYVTVERVDNKLYVGRFLGRLMFYLLVGMIFAITGVLMAIEYLGDGSQFAVIGIYVLIAAFIAAPELRSAGYRFTRMNNASLPVLEPLEEQFLHEFLRGGSSIDTATIRALSAHEKNLRAKEFDGILESAADKAVTSSKEASFRLFLLTAVPIALMMTLIFLGVQIYDFILGSVQAESAWLSLVVLSFPLLFIIVSLNKYHRELSVDVLRNHLNGYARFLSSDYVGDTEEFAIHFPHAVAFGSGVAWLRRHDDISNLTPWFSDIEGGRFDLKEFSHAMKWCFGSYIQNKRRR